MILAYGNYSHAQNECAVVISKRPYYSSRGFRQGVRETWTITGVLQASTQAGITTAIALLRSAYAVNGLDVALYLDDGSTLTDHFILSRNTLGGVRVIAFEFPNGTGAEYSTFRSYSITLEADFADATPLLLEFDESLDFSGTGGARRVLVETMDGPPQEQIVANRTIYRASQSGRSVGSFTWPPIPSPIWPAAEMLERRRTKRKTPRRVGNNATEYAVEWSYEFESGSPLSGNPTVQ